MTSLVSGVQVGHTGEGGHAADYIVTIRLRSPRGELLAVKEALAYDLEKYGDIAFVNVETVPEGSSRATNTSRTQGSELEQLRIDTCGRQA